MNGREYSGKNGTNVVNITGNVPARAQKSIRIKKLVCCKVKEDIKRSGKKERPFREDTMLQDGTLPDYLSITNMKAVRYRSCKPVSPNEKCSRQITTR